MDNEKIQNFLLSKGKYLPMYGIDAISSKLKSVEDEKLIYRIHALNFMNPMLITLLYWLCPLFFFIDRFFVGSTLSGLVKFFILAIIIPIFFLVLILTHEPLLIPIFVVAGIWFLWILIDGFTIYGRVKRYNLSILIEAMN